MQTTWNLALLYKSHTDPHIEKDVKAFEAAYSKFEKKYKGTSAYLKNESKLLQALSDFEAIFEQNPLSKPLMYFHYHMDLFNDAESRAMSSKLMSRLQLNENKVVFFELSLAKIPATLQKKFLKSKKLSHYSYYLYTVFRRAKHDLSESEEKILGLKSIPAYVHWITATDKILNKQVVTYKGKKMPLGEASSKIHELPLKERRELHAAVMNTLKGVSEIAESEINAIATDKKINDELRGFKEPYDATVLGYQNDAKSVLALVSAVTKRYSISHRFYNLKAKLLKLPHLEYSDRAVGIGENTKEITFEEAAGILKDVFGSADKRYLSILETFLENGQIDVFPKIGKTDGAYCGGGTNVPTFVLLNYTNSMDQVMTFAHEMGHAIHTEFSKAQTALYQNYTTSTAEVASTFFESMVFDAVFEKLSHKEKILALHKKINDDIQTIFRQIACFNFERELHTTIRKKGAVTREEIGEMLNKHMASYLGPIMKMQPLDGNHFVSWSHIRRFFYVYSYAFGQLISKALYAKYKEDKTYIEKINKFLSAGGSDSPENIFKSIGIDVTKPHFWEKGLASIDKDIDQLEKLTAGIQ